MNQKRWLPSPGTALGILALVVAMTGVAVGLPGKNTVNSGDIKNSAVNSGDIKNNRVKTADLAKPQVRSISFINSWGSDDSGCNAARIVKDVLGVVRLEGCIDRNAGTSDEPFDLPVGFRPSANVFEAIDVGGANHGRIVIEPNGNVGVYDAGTGNAGGFTSLEGVTFRAG